MKCIVYQVIVIKPQRDLNIDLLCPTQLEYNSNKQAKKEDFRSISCLSPKKVITLSRRTPTQGHPTFDSPKVLRLLLCD